jgi:hypothetical protein
MEGLGLQVVIQMYLLSANVIHFSRSVLKSISEACSDAQWAYGPNYVVGRGRPLAVIQGWLDMAVVLDDERIGFHCGRQSISGCRSEGERRDWVCPLTGHKSGALERQ